MLISFCVAGSPLPRVDVLRCWHRNTKSECTALLLPQQMQAFRPTASSPNAEGSTDTAAESLGCVEHWSQVTFAQHSV